MSTVLSDEQIAELFADAQEGRMPTASQPHRRAPRVREIDFSRPTKFGQDLQRRLERAHEDFCRSASGRLSAELRTPVELELIHADQLTWGTALEQIPERSLYGIVQLQPSGGRILLSAEHSLVVQMLDRLLGGQGSAAQARGRELTEIELRLTRQIFANLVDQLSPAWQELGGIELTLAELERRAPNIAIAPMSEPTCTLTIEVKLEGGSSTISLAIPYRAIEREVERLSGGYGDAAVASPVESALRAELARVDIALRAEVAAVDMTLDAVLALRPGDVVRLGAPAEAGVTLYADTIPLHRARPGRNGNRRAVEVLHRLEATP